MNVAVKLLRTARRFAAGAVLLGALAVAAAEGDAETPSEQGEEDAAEEAKEETPEKPDEDSGTLADVFTPSEEISEDIAVPFPVDI